MPRIAYVVHDLNDAAVARRVAMLQAAGGDVVVIGFYRSASAPEAIGGAPVIGLGQTADSALIQRVVAVVRNLVTPRRMLAAAAGAEVVIGRNLESLALASRIRQTIPSARLVYECLDIHRTLLGTSAMHRAVQVIESRLLRGIDLLIVSSPAFLRDYFVTRPGLTAPSYLAENKVLALDGLALQPVEMVAGPPWTIGWFGNLRCRKTFGILSDLARRHAGRVEILIAGRASPAVFDDFTRQVADAPHCTYIGPYTVTDLPAIYARCHFAWAIDYMEEGLNSRWLLPNRLYEASAFGAVPIALRSVETGRWLKRHHAGYCIDDERTELEALVHLSAAEFINLRKAINAIPRTDLITDRAACDEMMAAIQRR